MIYYRNTLFGSGPKLTAVQKEWLLTEILIVYIIIIMLAKCVYPNFISETNKLTNLELNKSLFLQGLVQFKKSKSLTVISP